MCRDSEKRVCSSCLHSGWHQRPLRWMRIHHIPRHEAADTLLFLCFVQSRATLALIIFCTTFLRHVLTTLPCVPSHFLFSDLSVCLVSFIYLLMNSLETQKLQTKHLTCSWATGPGRVLFWPGCVHLPKAWEITSMRAFLFIWCLGLCRVSLLSL